jgi:hypothetical protein
MLQLKRKTAGTFTAIKITNPKRCFIKYSNGNLNYWFLCPNLWQGLKTIYFKRGKEAACTFLLIFSRRLA